MATPLRVDQRPIVGVGERAAAGGHDGVAQREQPAEDFALGRPEVRLSARGEDVGHRAALARLDQLVDVLDAPSQAPAQRAGDGGLARAHEAHEEELVGLHAVSDPSTSKKPG